MKKRKFYFLLLLLFLSFVGITQSPFTPGNFVAYRIGDGTIPGGVAQDSMFPVFIDEFTPAGALVQSIAMPTTASGSNHMFNGALIYGAGGMITLSVDGRYLVAVAYDAPLYTTNVVIPTGGFTNRVIGLIDYNGAINTSTSLTDYSMNNQAISAVSTNGTDLWACGLGVDAASAGVRYTTVGSTTSTQLNTTPTTLRGLNITDGQLYVSQASNIHKVGTGLPTTSGQTLTPITGLPTGGVRMQYVFLDLNPAIPGKDVLYIADEGTGGLRKYSFDGSTWTLNGQIGASVDDYRGLTAIVSGTTVTLFITRIGANNTNVGGGEIVTLTDASGHGGAFSGTPTVFSSIATRFGQPNVASYRGLALVPINPAANISAKIFLQGAYNTGLGRHKDVTAGWASILNASALNQPFNTAAFGNYNGGESVSSGFFTSTGATTDILDWVLVELHDASTPATIVARKAAFVREDGQIVGLDGTSAVSFTGVPNANYYLVVRHRNHLGVRSSTTIAVNGGSTASYDFTTAQSKAFQDGAITANPAMKDLGSGVFGLWGGNANSNTNVRFTGLSNDAAAILAALSANQAAVLSNAYNNADLNMDGTVRYTGLNNDAAVVLSVLGSNQAAVFTQHQ